MKGGRELLQTSFLRKTELAPNSFYDIIQLFTLACTLEQRLHGPSSKGGLSDGIKISLTLTAYGISE